MNRDEGGLLKMPLVKEEEANFVDNDILERNLEIPILAEIILQKKIYCTGKEVILSPDPDLFDIEEVRVTI